MIFFKHRYSQNFISSNVNPVGLSIEDKYETIENIPFLIDIRCRKNFSSAQPLKRLFKFSEQVPAIVVEYAHIITNEKISNGSDGQKHFDLLRIQKHLYRQMQRSEF